MKTFHAAVWLDHNEARIFHIAKDGFDETVIHPEKPHRHLHRKSGPGAVSGKRTQGDPAFYEEISKALADSEKSWAAQRDALCPVFDKVEPGWLPGDANYCRMQTTANRALLLRKLGAAVNPR